MAMGVVGGGDVGRNEGGFEVGGRAQHALQPLRLRHRAGVHVAGAEHPLEVVHEDLQQHLVGSREHPATRLVRECVASR